MTEQELLLNISRELSRELAEDVDNNFRNKGFYGEPWQPRKRTDRGSLLIRDGFLRASLTYTPMAKGLNVSSDLPYAAIHNEGGTIERTIQLPLTEKMRKFCWAKWYQTKDPKYKAMALTRKEQISIRQRIHIPARRFIGNHPKLRAKLDQIAKAHLRAYAIERLNTLKRK